MRIFVDVGGYRGHSTLAALDPRFGFERIYCFEPVPELANHIRQIKDPRLVVVEACLAGADGVVELYHAGTLAGSMFGDAPTYGGEGRTIRVRSVSASTFVSIAISNDDFVRFKLNCEGAEIEIITALLDVGLEKFLRGALLDFDARKICSIRDRVTEIEKRLKDSMVSYLTPPECQFGMVTNYGGVRNYLLYSGAKVPGLSRLIRSLIYNIRLALNPEVNGYHKMRVLKLFPILRILQQSRG